MVHQRAHDCGQSETRKNLRIVRGMELRSARWKLVGKADVVEFRHTERGSLESVTVVEYKRGIPKKKLDLPFEVQVCAQVFCLEEMLNRKVDQAFLYYAKAKRRLEIPLDERLRGVTAQAIEDLHQLITSGQTPGLGYQKRKCDRCSLISVCVPKGVRVRFTASRYIQSLIDGEPGSLPADNL